MNTKLNQTNQKNQPKGGFTMFKQFGLSTALIGLAIVSLTGMFGQAQTANVTSTVTFFNQSVFISKVADFPVAAAITKENVEAGCKSLGSAKVNIDASSAYTVTA
jgi:hypothetical protein